MIDSNLDWGQDLVALQKWWKKTIPGEPIGLAYFGQINPSIFKLRGDSFDWFLPPVKPGAARADGAAVESGLDRSGQETHAGLLCDKCDAALRFAMAVV